jgi:hypothetical protein
MYYSVAILLLHLYLPIYYIHLLSRNEWQLLLLLLMIIIIDAEKRTRRHTPITASFLINH